jgi:hypothetical protein
MFRLSKWYLDCVAEDGNTVMLYWAALRWGPLRLHFGSVLHRTPGGGTDQTTTLRPDCSPTTDDRDRLTWVCSRLRARGEWKRATDPIERTLLDGPAGKVHWQCVMPRARAKVGIGDHSIAGLGYAEHLTMTLPPWRVPCDVLRWGRYLAPDDDAVWIRWDGPSTRSWVFRRGVEQDTPTITDAAIDMGDAHLAMSEELELRSGRLVHTALRPLALLVSALPRWRGATETKWLARGALSAPGVSNAGWVIHEIVRWP